VGYKPWGGLSIPYHQKRGERRESHVENSPGMHPISNLRL